MNISFSILDTEVDLIASLYGYDVKSGDKDEFVLEQFKKFGRDSIISQVSRVALENAENSKNATVEAAKSEVSF